MIKVDVVGKILRGQDAGWHIVINSDGGAGYFLYIFNNANPDEATETYDYWLQNRDSLQAQMEYFGWEIEWLE